MIYNKKEEQFITVLKIKEFIGGLNKIVVNIPNNEKIIKEKIIEDAYQLLEIVYKANFTMDYDERKKNKIIALTKISMLDYYFEICYKNKYINEKCLIKECDQLLNINKMIYAWIKNEERV